MVPFWSGRVLAFLGGLDALPASLSNAGMPASIPAIHCKQLYSKLLAVIESAELSLTVMPPRS
jgi:hypothetical protein